MQEIMYTGYMADENTSTPQAIPLSDKIKNEIILTQRLENLNVQITNLWKSFVNSFLRQRSKEYKEWVSVGSEIEQESLTEEGQLRLRIKHALMQDRILPQHSVILLTLAPFIVYWLLKKGATYLISSRIEAYQKAQARTKRRLAQSKEKETRRQSKGLPR